MGADSKITKEIWEGWLEPFQATKLLIDAGLESRAQAVSWLKARLRLGELRAAGVHYELDEKFETKRVFIAGYRRSVWRNIELIDAADDFWVSGDFEADVTEMWERAYRAYEDRPRVRALFEHSLTKVRFDPATIQAFRDKAQALPASILGAPTQAAPKQPGGRPPKQFWEALWAAIGAQLYNGDLAPTKQADIENAMNEWLTANGHEAGENTVRQRARALWQAIKSEDQN